MALPRAIFVLVSALALSLAITLLLRSAEGSRAQELEPAPEYRMGIEWAYRPDDVVELGDQSDALVEAEVTDVRDGPPIIVDDASPIPTQLIDVRTTALLSGEAPETFTLYKLGSEAAYAEGDPPYEVGQRYVIFVTPRPDGTYLPTAPDGRLLERPSGEVEPVIDGPVAEQVDGSTPAEVESAAAG
jgi:hypothetical protein